MRKSLQFTPWKIGPPLTRAQTEQEVVEGLVDGYTPGDVIALLASMPRKQRETLAWLGASPRGRIVIGRALLQMYKTSRAEVDAIIARVLAKTRKPRRSRKK
jgi:hypothetical protein